MIPNRPMPPRAIQIAIARNSIDLQRINVDNAVEEPDVQGNSTNQPLTLQSPEIETDLERTIGIDRSTAHLIEIIFDWDINQGSSRSRQNGEPARSVIDPSIGSSAASVSNTVRRAHMAIQRLMPSWDQIRQEHLSALPSVVVSMPSSSGDPGDGTEDLPTIPSWNSTAIDRFYTEVEEGPSMQRAVIEDMVRHSAIANSIYYEFEKELLVAERTLKNDDTLAHTAWRHFELPAAMRTELELESFDDGRLRHRKSDLVVIILQNDELKTIATSFGGTTAGKTRGNLLYRLLNNPLSSFRHWLRNLQSIGMPFTSKLAPDSYVQAAEVAKRIDAFVKQNANGQFTDYRHAVTGHSKGAAEAEYSALMNPGLRAVCFSTPPLGSHILKNIPITNLQIAKENIQHYFIQYDVVPSIHISMKYVLQTGHVGTARWLPAPAHIVRGPLYLLLAHDSFNHCVNDYAHRNAASASQTAPADDTRITIADRSASDS